MIRQAHDLHALGFSPADIRSEVRAGRLVRLRRGSYADAAGLGDGVDDRHRALIEAVAPRHSGAIVSHVSAAVLHGLPIPRRSLSRVHLIKPAPRSGSVRAASYYLHRHVNPPEPVLIDGIPTTDLARTTLDLARALSPVDGVAVVDAALARGLDREALLDQLAAAGRQPGNPRARRVIRFADSRSESAGESWSRWIIHELGLPAPDLQVSFDLGSMAVRSDFHWAGHDVVGEFDGWVKYGRLLRPGQNVQDVLRAEKEREQAFRVRGLWVIRWTAHDLRDRERFRDFLTEGLRLR